MKKLLALAISSSLILAGCATDPVTGKPKLNSAAIGALAGAASGTVISKATGGEKTGRDAAIGAALGAGVGYYMQQQEAKLKQQTAGTGIEVTRDPVSNNINLVMPESITFDVAQSDVKPTFYRTLDELAQTLSQYNQTQVIIKGHASSEGDLDFNQRLSQDRAISVADYLSQRGVSPARIRAIGYGISQPIASNETESGRMQNRRVEIEINAPQSVR